MMTPFESAMQASIAATEAGDFTQSLHLLDEAIRLQPESPIPYFLLGANCASEGKNDQAEAAFIACLSRAPDFAIARFQLGLLQLVNGRATTAQATWEPLLMLPKNHYLNCFTQGFLAILQGQKDEAKQLIDAGIAANTENLPLNGDMRGLLERLARVPETHGSANPETALETDPGFPLENGGLHYLVTKYGKE